MALDLASTLGAAQNAIGAVGGAINTASKLGDAISKGFEDGDVLSALRAIDLPTAGEAVGDLLSAVASFGGDANSNDWRVRLSLANWSSFRTSPVLAPLTAKLNSFP